MTFPVIFDIAGLSVHSHAVFELLAYSGGFRFYLWLRKRWRHEGVVHSREQNLWLIAACIIGALVGSKALTWLDAPLDYWAHRDDPFYWIQGKTIVGGLLGGWIGVEIAKKRMKITHATGDLYVFPLVVGIAVGRIGCFLSGLEDGTYGVATSLPWGIDFGDGIRRHPTQLYEIVAMLATGAWLAWRIRRPYVNGYLFRVFMFSYLGFRFLIEFVKPRNDYYLGLSMIQIACLIGALWCAKSIAEMRVPILQEDPG